MINDDKLQIGLSRTHVHIMPQTYAYQAADIRVYHAMISRFILSHTCIMNELRVFIHDKPHLLCFFRLGAYGVL